jgi:hypothetical protein
VRWRRVVLRLKVRVCYRNLCTEGLGVANSGFAGREPEITLPEGIARTLFSERPNVTLLERVLADGSRALLPRTTDHVDVYVDAGDRVEGPVKAHAYITRNPLILLNDALINTLKIVIIDPFEGLCVLETNLVERRGEVIKAEIQATRNVECPGW